jgi:hypothetical protein
MASQRPRTKILNYWCHHLGGKPRGRGQSEGHADALGFLALPHEPHVPAVGLADCEVHVKAGEVDLRNEIVPSDELLDGVQALYLEVLVLDVLVRPAQIDASTHFVGTFLRDREEGAPKAVGGLWRELLDGADLDIVLESG